MSNVLLTTDKVTKASVALFKNSNMFIKNLDTQYDGEFAVDGAKIGDAVRVRLPNDYTVRHGPALSSQDTNETFTSLKLQSQSGVDIAFSTAERTLKIDEYSERYIMPMMNNLAGDVAADIMSGADGGAARLVTNVDGSNNIISPSTATLLQAQAMLSDNSAPMQPGRKIVQDPWTEANVVSALSGLFNPSQKISEQFQSGQMKSALGFDFFMDQTVIKHTTGTYDSASGTVNGANQTGTSITVAAITGFLNKGDIITFDGVYAVNRVFKRTTGKLQQFVVTANVPAGATVIPIYPALTPPSGGNQVQYQTVTASPANAAVMRLASKAGETYRKNLAYAPKAITMATADLVIPKGVHEAARHNYDGVSLRMVTAYVMGTDQLATRLDILYGYLYVRPEWVCIVGDKI
jgi:hypothetical protein